MKGKTIENPIRQGLPSKIYLAAYAEPITGYELARKIFGTREVTKRTRGWNKPPEKKKVIEVLNPNKPYAIAKKYGELFDRPEENGKRMIFSRADVFLAEIEKYLKRKNEKLVADERKILKNYLDNEFRRAVKYIDYTQEKTVDAFSELLCMLLAALAYEQGYRRSKRIFKGHRKSLSPKRYSKMVADRLDPGPHLWKDRKVLSPLRDFSQKLLEKILLNAPDDASTTKVMVSIINAQYKKPLGELTFGKPLK